MGVYTLFKSLLKTNEVITNRFCHQNYKFVSLYQLVAFLMGKVGITCTIWHLLNKPTKKQSYFYYRQVELHDLLD